MVVLLLMGSIHSSLAQKHKAITQWSIEIKPINAVTFREVFKSKSITVTPDSNSPKRCNGIIDLPLRNGKKITFKDNKGVPHDEDRTSHIYLGQVKFLDCYLVEKNLFESTDYLLINKKTGITDTLAGLPVLSPDGKTICCTNFNPYEEHADIQPPTQDIYLSSVTDRRLSRPQRLSYNKMMITGYSWADNSSLVISYKVREEDNDHALKYARLFLKRK